MKNSLLSAVVGYVVVVLLMGCVAGCDNTTDNYIHKGYDEETLIMSYNLVGCGDTFGAGSIKAPDHESLARRIYQTREQFDADYGHKTAHWITEHLREKFYKQLKNDIESDPRFNMNGDSEKEFADTFQQTFGDLPDTDGDGYPDVADTDDDNDGVGDAVDDDDDNDGCLDRDEKDGNTGGETGDLTGKGRGDGPCDWMPEKVKPDDPDFDPGYTSRFDDGL